MKVLVTGAAGRLGSAVCAMLGIQGYQVVGTDRKPARQAGARFEIVDLLDEQRVSSLVRGFDAVVHLGNHPRLSSDLPDERLFTENVAMNRNVFQAVVAHRVPRVVFSSSLQVMIPMPGGAPPAHPYPLPYLPLDGEAPRSPGSNRYALSKAAAEEALEAIAKENRSLHCSVLRLPALPDGFWLRRFGKGNRVALSDLNWGEGLTYLLLEDAAQVIAATVERGPVGYHQFLPAQALEIQGCAVRSIIESYYPRVRLTRPIETISSLVDVERLKHDIGWGAKRKLAVTLAESGAPLP